MRRMEEGYPQQFIQFKSRRLFGASLLVIRPNAKVKALGVTVRTMNRSRLLGLAVLRVAWNIPIATRPRIHLDKRGAQDTSQ